VRKRKVDEELRPRELGETGKETAGERSLAGEAVRLQELLGNANATEVMASSLLQRDATAEAAPAKKGAEEQAGSTYVVTMSNDIGTFELESVSFGAGRAAPGAERGGEGKEPPVSEVVATKKADAHSPKLLEFAAKSKPIDRVEIVMRSGGKVHLTVVLTNVVIANYQAGSGGSDPIESFTLNFAGIEFQPAE
jgi:type VI protein secretion system component Hcp